MGPNSTGSMANSSPVGLDPLLPRLVKMVVGSKAPALAHCLSQPAIHSPSQPRVETSKHGPSYKCHSPSGLTPGEKHH